MSSVRVVVLICCVFWSSSHGLWAQEKRTGEDSTLRYENVDGYSSQRGFTRFMYRLFYDPVATGEKLRIIKKRAEQVPYPQVEGKVIRNIFIETLDPFGNSSIDTSTASLTLLTRLGNKIHLKTHPSIIENLLMIRAGQPYDSLLVKESERLVRSMPFITDVSFFTLVASPEADSVDVFIRVLDIWSIVPVVSFTSGRFALEMGDDNLLGFGHAFRNSFLLDRETGGSVNQASYFIPNIGTTMIHALLRFGTDEDGHFSQQMAAERPLFSPYASWAAGIGFLQQSRGKPMGNDNGLRYQRNAQDVWAGGAAQLFKGDSEFCRTTRLVASARFLRIRYPELPLQTLDPTGVFADETVYLATISFASWRFVQDQFVYKFGLTEDLPVGKVASITAGFQQKNDSGRVYLAAGLGYGNYHSWGYLRPAMVVGAFMGSSGANEGVFEAGVYFFSNLMETGRWKFRQFVKSQITLGIHRAAHDRLTLNNEFGIKGFNSPELTGNGRLLLSLQTQSYPPWNFIGFDFGPYFTCSLGMLKDSDLGFRNQKIYAHLGLGVLIKNQRLLMNTFQVSVSYYPDMPGSGTNLFRVNSFRTNDFGWSGFGPEKPAIKEFL